MVKSAPNSPQPDSNRRKISQNKDKKTDTSNHLFHLPQLKCIQKLPVMSPRLKRVLSLKNSIKIKRHRKKSQRRKSSDERQIALALEKLHRNINTSITNNDFDNDDSDEKCDTSFNRSNLVQSYGHTLAVPSLKMISERNSASETDSDDQSDAEDKPKQECRFADVVINLLRKKRREQEYTALNTNDDDNDIVSKNIQSENISESDGGLCKTLKDVSAGKQCSDGIDSVGFTDKNSFNQSASCDTQRERPKLEPIKITRPTRPEVSSSLPVPKIVLTRDTNMSSR